MKICANEWNLYIGMKHAKWIENRSESKKTKKYTEWWDGL